MQITLKAHSIYVNGPYRAHAQDVRRQRFGRSISQPIQPSRQYHAPHGSGNVCVPPGIGFSPVGGFLWRMLGCGYGQYGLVREALTRLVSWCFSDVSYFRRVSAMARKHCEASQSGLSGGYLFFTAQSQTVPSVFCAASLCKSPSYLSCKRGAMAVLRTRRMSSAHVVFRIPYVYTPVRTGQCIAREVFGCAIISLAAIVKPRVFPIVAWNLFAVRR